MGGMRCSAIFFASLLIFSLYVGVNADESEVEDESAFTYEGVEKGPEQWGKLNPKWEACTTGKLQSPIDLTDGRVDVVSKLGNMKREYKPAPAKIKNRGHDIEIVWQGDAGNAILNGSAYRLQQCHWHSPSEHTLNGKRYDLEIHLVHNNSEGHLAVIGVIYELGTPDPFLEKLLQRMDSQLSHEGSHLGSVDPWEIKFGGPEYYRYVGSLTVPPCTEGVLWTLPKTLRTVSKDQVKALRDAVHDGYENNARPTQKSNLDVFVFHQAE